MVQRILGLQSLATASQLKSLTLYHTHFTNDGFAALCEMRNLERLKVGSNDITGDALEHVSKLKNLSHFGALHWQLGDEDLRWLSKLKHLDLSSTSVAKNGVAAKQLQTALPRCKVLLPSTQAEIDVQKSFLEMKYGN